MLHNWSVDECIKKTWAMQRGNSKQRKRGQVANNRNSDGNSKWQPTLLSIPTSHWYANDVCLRCKTKNCRTMEINLYQCWFQWLQYSTHLRPKISYWGLPCIIISFNIYFCTSHLHHLAGFEPISDNQPVLSPFQIANRLGPRNKRSQILIGAIQIRF